MTLPALAAERRRRKAAAIDGYLLQAPRPATASRTFMLYAVDRRDRQTDRQTDRGRTPVRYIHPILHTLWGRRQQPCGQKCFSRSTIIVIKII